MHCIMGKPTARKPGSSSTENSCISREAHVCMTFACVHDVVYLYVKLERFTVEHSLRKAVYSTTRQLDD